MNNAAPAAVPTTTIYDLLVWSGSIHLDGRDMVCNDASPVNASGETLYDWAYRTATLGVPLSDAEMDRTLEAFRKG